jgi:cellulose synthase/poly-beta-1,6-N-acetylglucosamine synthase-like glycosyltransferase
VKAGARSHPTAAQLPVGELLVRRGVLHRRILDLGLQHQQEEHAALGEVLISRGFVDELNVYRALGEQWGTPCLVLDKHWVDEGLARALPSSVALTHRIVPIRATPTLVVVAMADPRSAEAVQACEAVFGRRIVTRLAPPGSIRQVQERVFHRPLVIESTRGLETRQPEECAHQLLTRPQRTSLVVLGVVAVLGFIILRSGFFIVLAGIVISLYAAVVVFRTYVIYRGAKYGRAELVTPEEIAGLTDLPTYTILCPLFREAGVLPQLVKAISSLNYPLARLDVKLLLEADDVETLEAIREYRLASYFDVVVVPAEGQRTKPKACNYGLLLARGEYTVIFDAEDVPEPDQLKKALCIFRRHPENLGCVQAKLNYYNAHQNILTGWFALEYLGWFTFFLPGLQDLGLPIPLGGSSNHLRTDLLREVGAWDPNNVTEDADLGMRLLRHGYQTVVMDSTTGEEANSDFVNWVRQRSRWGKGYAVSWLVQMRHPSTLLRDVGFWGWIAIQLTLGGAYALSLLNLLMWTLTILWFLTQFGFIAYLFPGWIYFAALLELLFGNFFFIYLNVWSAEHLKDYRLARLALLSPFYWLMMSLAMIKATLQIVGKSTFWEKTVHGLYAEPTTLPPRGMGALSLAERQVRASIGK